MTSYYRKHVFFCTNLKDKGKKCCAMANAEQFRSYAKAKISALNLSGEKGIRINISGCLDRCALGPVLVIYPDSVWYTYQSEADIDEIIESHLLNGKLVERLMLDLPPESKTK